VSFILDILGGVLSFTLYLSSLYFGVFYRGPAIEFSNSVSVRWVLGCFFSFSFDFGGGV